MGGVQAWRSPVDRIGWTPRAPYRAREIENRGRTDHTGQFSVNVAALLAPRRAETTERDLSLLCARARIPSVDQV
jgi:hypothetical protein